MRQVPITPPIRGFAGLAARSEQTPGTYGDGLNVRGVDWQGRARPCRRGGLLPVSTRPVCAHGDAVTGGFQVGRDDLRERWRQLTTEDQEGVTPSKVDPGWSTDLAGQAVAVTRNTEGLIYALLDTGDVQVLDEQGAVKETIPSRVPVDFTPVGIAIDEQGAVLVGSSYGDLIDGRAGEIVRLARQPSGDWIPRGLAQYPAALVHFAYRFGVVAALLESVEEGAATEFLVTKTAGLPGQNPTTVWTRRVANPSIRVAIGTDGSFFVASPPNASRAIPDSGSFGPATASWTPREGVTGEYDPETELYSWLDPVLTRDTQLLVDGQDVNLLRDARFLPSDFDAPSDATDRPAQRAKVFSTVLEESPTFVANGGAGVPVVRFAGETERQYLRSRVDTGPQEKALASDQAANSRSFIPRMQNALDEQGTAFGTLWSFRCRNYGADLTEEETDKVLVLQGEYRISYRRTSAASTMSVKVEIPMLNAAVLEFDYEVPGSTHDADTTVCVVIAHNGADVAGSRVRINGLETATFEADVVGTAGQNRACLIGGPSADDSSGMPAQADFYRQATVLGKTSGAPAHQGSVPDTTLEHLEGFAMHAGGMQDALPVAHPFRDAAPVGVGDSAFAPLEAGINEPEGLLVKFSGQGQVRWLYTAPSAGNGVATGLDGRVYTAGTSSGTSGSTMVGRVAALDDEGTTFDVVWEYGASEGMRWWRDAVEMIADPCGGLVMVWAEQSLGARYVRSFARDRGAADGFGFRGQLMWSYLEVQGAFIGVMTGGDAIDLSTIGGVCGPELVLVLRDTSMFALPNLGRVEGVDGDGRLVEQINVCESGAIVRRESATEYEILQRNALTGERPWMAQVYPYFIFGDGGDRYYVWDAFRRRMRSFEAVGQGNLPPRATVGFNWRGRFGIVNPQNRGQLMLSAFGDPLNFNTAGEVISANDAVTTTFSRAAQFPDRIVGVAPFSDDLLLIGGEKQWWRLTGDPMLSGQQDAITSAIGLADEWAHTMDAQGRLIYMGTDRNIWRMTTQSIERMSEGAVHDEFRALDLKRYRVEIAASPVEFGFWVVLIPREGNEPVQHWFREDQTGAWHPQAFVGEDGSRSVTCVSKFDGDDPDDLGLLFGFADGWVRRIDPRAEDDDGLPVPNHVDIGPLLPASSGVETILEALNVVASVDGGPLQLEVYGGPTAEITTSRRPARTVEPGERRKLPVNMRTASARVRLFGTGGPWALEELSAEVSGGHERGQR